MTSAAPLQFLILLVAGWMARRQGEAIEYLRAENRVLRARLGPKRLCFAEAERRLLAEMGKPLGQKLLAEMASLATPYCPKLDPSAFWANCVRVKAWVDRVRRPCRPQRRFSS